jgi:glycosyltransferase involved in cell wall biosynthesis
MRIAQIATLNTRVCPSGAGSIEGLVWSLTHQLSGLGHEVTVFAIAGSTADGRVVETLPGTYGKDGAPDDWQLCEWINLSRAVEQAREFDLIHSHNYLYGLPLGRLTSVPIIHTLHVVATEDSYRLRQMFPEAVVNGISKFQWAENPALNTPVIYHGVDPEQFTFNNKPQDYLCFFGRFTPGKGPLQAIECAQALGMRLVMAGPRNNYYESAISQYVDGKVIRFTGGGINVSERNELLSNAKALLYPLQDPEPFGLVMIEAMMCGTPVAAYSIGAVSEIIDEGVTGYTADRASSLAPAVYKVLELDRAKVREKAVKRFSATRMAREYERLYAGVVSEKRN